MKYLIDTHILLWIEDDRAELSEYVKGELENYSNSFFISMYSFQEIALKLHIKKLKLQVSLIELMDKTQKDYGIKIIPVEKHHIIEYSRLTIKPDHNDPFDHMIISQAIADKYTLISSDHNFSFYCKQGLSLLENN
jgi:PIN domain nuclease of toxin-antitoxin system